MSMGDSWEDVAEMTTSSYLLDHIEDKDVLIIGAVLSDGKPAIRIDLEWGK